MFQCRSIFTFPRIRLWPGSHQKVAQPEPEEIEKFKKLNSVADKLTTNTLASWEHASARHK